VSVTKPEIEGVSIVLVGSFNPAIFHPDWFAREKLIQNQEAEKADVQIVSKEASFFSIGWLNLEVLQEKFTVSTSQIQHLDSMRDLVIGTFKLLRHMPVKQLGINRTAHFRADSALTWHALGHRLAPKEPWAGLLEGPGMLRVMMMGNRPDGFQGRIIVTVEPSVRLAPGVGVFVDVNDHFEIAVDGNALESERMMEILAATWQDSLDRAMHIMQGVIKTQ